MQLFEILVVLLYKSSYHRKLPFREILHCGYSAINANAFETVVFAIVFQLQSPHKYLR